MNRIVLFFMLMCSFSLKSQIISDSVRSYNCIHDGAIFLDIFSSSQVDFWQFNDQDLGWIDADTISSVFYSANQDTLITQKCGSYRVIILGDTSNTFYIGCPLGTRSSHENINCYGDSSGLLKSVAYSGAEPYFYEWYFDSLLYSSGYDDTVIYDLPIGNYQFIVIDSLGCTDSLSSIISSPSELVFDTVYSDNINCRNINSGSISFSVSGGKPFFIEPKYDSYLIDLTSGDTISFVIGDSISSSTFLLANSFQVIFDSLYAGNYLLSVSDSLNCTLLDTFILTQPYPYQTFASTTFPLICESDSGYLMIDSVIGGGNINFGFNYDILQGPNGDSLFVPSGWYNIFIEDLDFGCIDTVSVRCSAQFEINVNASITHVDCFGHQTGSVIIDTIYGGNYPYDVQWGSYDNEFLYAGSYLVNIVDSIGCVHQESFELNESDQIVTNALISPSNCFGGEEGFITIDLSGGTTPLSYNWLNGTGTPDSLYALSDGLYVLIVNDGLSCIDTFNFVLQSPDLLEIDLTADQLLLSCNGALTTANIIVNGGVDPYSFVWNDSDTTQQRIIGAGNYLIDVIDSNGCIASDSIVILEPDSLEIFLDYSDIGCDFGATASITYLGGVPPISFLWSTGDTTSSIDSLWDLTYWVVVTDSCGTSVSDTINLEYYELNTDINYNESTYSADVEVFSSTSEGPFGFAWINIFGDTISFTENIYSLCEGTYFAVTTDFSNDCSVVDTLLVEYDLPFGIVDVLTTTVYDDINLWGASPYSYLWSNGQVKQKSDLCPGSHWVEVTDVNNCLVREDFTIDDLIITLDPASSIIECNLENLDVNIQATATGGIAPYSFQWWNGFVGNSINLGLNPGNYSLTVTDANNCINDTSFKIASLTSECIPNVFSPNGDNINDSWSLEDTFLYSDSKVSIYGRFGSLIFESVGYYEKWNGTNTNGAEVPDGVYFYSIELGNGFDPINGTISILR